MRQSTYTLTTRTHGQALYDITAPVRTWCSQQQIRTGLLTLWCRHTSASLTVQENADPDVRADLLSFLRQLAPENAPYRHTIEGPDDMPAHIKTLLTQTSLSIPLMEGALVLGTWQAIYLLEHRTAPNSRTVAMHLLGE